MCIRDSVWQLSASLRAALALRAETSLEMTSCRLAGCCAGPRDTSWGGRGTGSSKRCASCVDFV
eukprot:12444204-Alexandrium_andersonii.AAC.1